MKRAWRTTAAGVRSIVAAETRGQAAGITLRSACEVGYRVKFPDVKVERAPEHDAWAEVDASRTCWGEEYLPKTKVSQCP